jgi:hypothetical protein
LAHRKLPQINPDRPPRLTARRDGVNYYNVHDRIDHRIDHQPPTTDHRPPTTDHRPPTTDHRPPYQHSAGANPPRSASPPRRARWPTANRPYPAPPAPAPCSYRLQSIERLTQHRPRAVHITGVCDEYHKRSLKKINKFGY